MQFEQNVGKHSWVHFSEWMTPPPHNDSQFKVSSAQVLALFHYLNILHGFSISSIHKKQEPFTIELYIQCSTAGKPCLQKEVHTDVGEYVESPANLSWGSSHVQRR